MRYFQRNAGGGVWLERVVSVSGVQVIFERRWMDFQALESDASVECLQGKKDAERWEERCTSRGFTECSEISFNSSFNFELVIL